MRQYGAIASTIKNPYFITFTWPRQRLTREVIRDIRAAFRDLYTAGGWSGLYQIECGTVKREGLDWNITGNVHIHAIIEDGEFSRADLFLMWYWATNRRAYVIDTERIWSRKGAMHYLTKHMIKAAYKGDIDTAIAERINATLRGVRLVGAFGRLYGYVPDPEKPGVLCDCGNVMTPIFYFSRELLLEIQSGAHCPVAC